MPKYPHSLLILFKERSITSLDILFPESSSNPTYYGVEESSAEAINRYLSDLIKETVKELLTSQCIITHGESLSPTKLGKIASFYYISHKLFAISAPKLPLPLNSKIA